MKINKNIDIAMCTLIVVLCPVLAAWAQEQDEVTVEIEALEVEDNVYTPYYEVRTVLDHEQGANKKWLQFRAEYTTSGGWVDDLTVRHIALVHDPAIGEPVILNTEVDYINIKPGDHYSNVYMHPSLVERYEVGSAGVDTAVQILIDDEVVAQRATYKEAEKG